MIKKMGNILNVIWIFQLLKAQGKKVAPRQIAQNVVNNLPQSEMIEKVIHVPF